MTFRILARILAPAVAALILLTAVTPASAGQSTDARRQREQARAERARLAAKLDTLTASDRQLEEAVAALDDLVTGQAAATAAARRAAAASEQAQAAAAAKVTATRDRIANTRQLVIDQAVARYMAPSEYDHGPTFSSDDALAAARAEVFADLIAADGADLIDQLAAAEEDLVLAEQEAKRAAQAAAQRRQAAEARLAELSKARNDQARVRAGLQHRIAAYQAEADSLAREDAQLTAIINREAARRAPTIVGDGPASAAGLIWPVQGRTTSEYGQRWGRMHYGLDIAAPTGTRIVAAKAGVVTFVGQQGGYGNIVVVDHGGGFSTVYPHQSRLAASDGQRVSQGEVIGYVGSTGNSTGPHLHFETRVNGRPQNPRQYLP